MTTPFAFPSLLHPDKYAFAICSDSTQFWDTAYRHGAIMSLGAGVFDTFGDGMTQHSALYCGGTGHFTDFCLSLAKHLLDHPEAELESSYLFRHDDLPDDAIQFLAGIRYNEEKRTWYNFPERKVSASTSKQYDKRWTAVPDYADGSIASAYHLWTTVLDSPVRSHLELYALQDRFWLALYHSHPAGDDWESKITAWHSQLDCDHLQAMRALRTVLAGREKLKYARRIFECAMNNTQQALEPKTASTEAQPVVA